jgi:hypothetical protein
MFGYVPELWQGVSSAASGEANSATNLGGISKMVWNQSTVQALGRIATTRDKLAEGGEVLRRQVIEARGAGASWESIGRMLGCTGEAARVKYGPKMARKQTSAVTLW